MEKNKENISFSEFIELWVSEFGDKGTNLWETYKKFSDLNPIEAKKSFESLKISISSSAELNKDRKNLIPMIKTADYVEFVTKNFDSINKKVQFKVIDDKETLFLMVFVKGEEITIGEKKICNYSYSFFQNFEHSLFCAYENFLNDKLKFSFPTPHFEEFVLVSSENLIHPILHKIILPSFIQKLKETLNIAENDQLIIVPYARNILYATKSSSFLGCCMLGDFADASDAHKSTPEWISSLPYTIKTINTSEPEFDLIKKGIIPIQWTIYEFFGKDPGLGVEINDKIYFHVPGSSLQAQAFLEKIKVSQGKPLIYIIKVSSLKFCATCYKENVHLKCGNCFNVYFCSKECQVSNWKFHKLICKKKIVNMS